MFLIHFLFFSSAGLYHKPEELTLAVLKSKLKSIRGKFGEAVAKGKTSGMGKVVYVFHSLCADIWGGGSPSIQPMEGLTTTQMSAQREAAVGEGEQAVGERREVVVGGEGGERKEREAEEQERRQRLEESLGASRKRKMQGRMGEAAQTVALLQEDFQLKRRALEDSRRLGEQTLDGLSSQQDCWGRRG